MSLEELWYLFPIQLTSHKNYWKDDYLQMENYLKDIIGTFKDDARVLWWDLYNEPGNSGHNAESLPLLKNAYKWAREVNPSQPISSGLWYLDCPEINAFQVENSDIISYHNYLDPETMGNPYATPIPKSFIFSLNINF